MEMKYISMLLGSFLLVAAGCSSEQAVDSEETHTETAEAEANSSKEAVQPVETVQEEPTNEDQINEETDPIEDIKVHFIDAGQADATLFEYSEGDEDYAVLFDAGDWNQDDVVHYLNTEGIENIDVMMLSHPHADHIGQADRIIENFSVDEVFMSGEIQTSQTFERVIDAIDYHDVGYEESRAGDIYDVGPLQIEMINPENLDSDENNNSLAARFQYGDDFSVMLTGDVEEATEAQIVSRGYTLETDILQLGHHGSDTSSSSIFIDEVDPAVAIYSAGEDNQYGHPHDSVLAALEGRGTEVYGTSVDGTIVVTSDGESYDIETIKEEERTSEDIMSSDNESEHSSNNPDENVEEEAQEECIDINVASSEQLQSINQIGEERAEQIEELRPFSSIDDMERISGIGPARVDEIKAEGLACIGG